MLQNCGCISYKKSPRKIWFIFYKIIERNFTKILQNGWEMTQQQHQLTRHRARCSRSFLMEMNVLNSKVFWAFHFSSEFFLELRIFFLWQDDDEGEDENLEVEQKCPEGYEHNPVLKICNAIPDFEYDWLKVTTARTQQPGSTHFTLKHCKNKFLLFNIAFFVFYPNQKKIRFTSASVDCFSVLLCIW